MSDERYLSPIILQSLGAVLVIASFVFWIIEDRESALLMGAALTLVAGGGLQGIRLRARDERIVATQDDRTERAEIRREQRLEGDDS